MCAETVIPLLDPDRHARVAVWDDGHPVTQAALLHTALELAARLPRATHVLNACSRRHPFLVAWLAAIIRDQIVVLPNDRTPRVAEALRRRFPGLYVVTDAPEETVGPLLQIEVRPHVPATPGPVTVPAVRADRTAAIVFTSGSTGTPQPNKKSLAGLVTTARYTAERFALDRGGPAAIVATVPPQHMYGLETSVALPLWTELSVASVRPFYPADIAKALAEVPGPRVLVTTPIHLRALLAARTGLPELAMMVSATAPLSAEMAGEAEARFAAPLFEIYGCSEAGTVATRRTAAGTMWRTCGELTLHEEDGICFVEAPHFAEPIALQDVIELHSARAFELHGRLADNVNIAGKRTSLSGLSVILNEIEGVLDGAFYLTEDDDPDKPGRLIAFVVAPDRTAEEIRAELRDRIDPVFLPRRIYLVSSLPRGENSKLKRAALEELARKMTAV